MPIQQHGSNDDLFEVPHFGNERVSDQSRRNSESIDKSQSYSLSSITGSKSFCINDNDSVSVNLPDYTATDFFLRDNITSTTEDITSTTDSIICNEIHPMNANGNNVSKRMLPSFDFLGISNRSLKSDQDQVSSSNSTKKEFVMKENELLKDMVLDLHAKVTNSENVIDKLEKEIALLKETLESQAIEKEATGKSKDYRVSFPTRGSIYGDGRYPRKDSIYGDMSYNSIDIVPIKENTEINIVKDDQKEENLTDKQIEKKKNCAFSKIVQNSWMSLAPEIVTATDEYYHRNKKNKQKKKSCETLSQMSLDKSAASSFEVHTIKSTASILGVHTEEKPTVSMSEVNMEEMSTANISEAKSANQSNNTKPRNFLSLASWRKREVKCETSNNQLYNQAA